jgi:hypothetical protein
VDAVVMVVEDNRTNREDITRSYQLLAGTNLVGVVLNKSRERTAGESSNGRNASVLHWLFKRG